MRRRRRLIAIVRVRDHEQIAEVVPGRHRQGARRARAPPPTSPSSYSRADVEDAFLDRRVARSGRGWSASPTRAPRSPRPTGRAAPRGGTAVDRGGRPASSPARRSAYQVGPPARRTATSAAAAFSSTASRTGAGASGEQLAGDGGVTAASPPRSDRSGTRAIPRSRGSSVLHAHLAAAHDVHRRGVRRGEFVESVVAAEHQHARRRAARRPPPSPGAIARTRSRPARPAAAPGWSAGRAS